MRRHLIKNRFPSLWRSVCWTAVLSAMVLAASVPLASAADEAIDRWQVKSVYKDPVFKTWKKTIVWDYTLTATPAGYTVTIADRAGRMPLQAVMLMDPDSRLVRLTRSDQIRQAPYELTDTFDSDKPAIRADAVVPCNWLNLATDFTAGDVREVEVVDTVSDTARFVSRYQVSAASVTHADAVSAAMLDADMAGRFAAADLTLVTAHKIEPDGSLRRIVSQLWAAGFHFWLYEETPSRRSHYQDAGDS